jgi:hypothetical protein
VILRLGLTLLAALSSPALAVDMARANGAELRLLDKLTGALQDAKISTGQSASMGKITVQLNDCRYPADNQTAEAEAHLTIIDAALPNAAVFQGWMIASSPALSALDHPRYDVWVLRCDVPELDLPVVDPAPPTTEAADGQ